MTPTTEHIISTIAASDAEYRELHNIATEDEQFAVSMGLTYQDVFGEPPQAVKDELECEAIGLVVTECFPDGASVEDIAIFGEYAIAAPNGRSLGALWSISNGMCTDGSVIYPNLHRAALERWHQFKKYFDNKQVVVDINIKVAA